MVCLHDSLMQEVDYFYTDRLAVEGTKEIVLKLRKLYLASIPLL